MKAITVYEGMGGDVGATNVACATGGRDDLTRRERHLDSALIVIQVYKNSIT